MPLDGRINETSELSLQGVANENLEQKITEFFEQRYKNKLPYQQEAFIREFARVNPQFMRLFQELATTFISKVDSFDFQENAAESRELKAGDIQRIIKEQVMSILDNSVTQTTFDTSHFQEGDWKYYFETLLGESRGRAVERKLSHFKTTFVSAEFRALPPEQQLRLFVQALGTDINSIIEDGRGNSVIAKVHLIEKFLLSGTGSTSPRIGDILSAQIENQPNQAYLVRLARLCDMSYIDMHNRRISIPQDANGTGGESSPVFESRLDFYNWRKIILSSIGVKREELGNIEPERLKTELKRVLPWLPVDFYNISRIGNNETINTEILEAAHKVMKLQDNEERSMRLVGYQETLNQYDIVTQYRHVLTGFSMTVFQDKQTKEIVFSIRGTDAIVGPDLVNDVQLALFKHDNTVRPMQLRVLQGFVDNFARDYAPLIAGNNIVFAGHSLGGSLAEFTSTGSFRIPANMAGRVTSFNFNGPGLRAPNLRRTGPSYHIANGDPIGTRGAPLDMQIAIHTLPGRSLVNTHSIASVEESLSSDNRPVTINARLIRSILSESVESPLVS